MSDVISKKCDNCGTVKAEVNGWWVIGWDDDGLIDLLPHHHPNIVERAEYGHKEDVCGQACLVAKVGKIVSKVGSENVSRDRSGHEGEGGGKGGGEILSVVAEPINTRDNERESFDFERTRDRYMPEEESGR